MIYPILILEFISESQIEIYGIHIKGYSLETLLEDIIQTPCQVSINTEMTEGKP
jgi:hypothetical protein